MKHLKTLVAAGALAFGLQHAQAVNIPLLPNTSTAPGLSPAPSSALLASVTDSFDLNGTSALFGSVTTRVYAPDATVSPLGGLIFTYTITLQNNGAPGKANEALGRISTVDWTGFLADAGQTALANGAASANRTSPDVIGFTFRASGDTLVGGEVSATLILGSDANSWKKSVVNLIDGGIDDAASLAPDNRVTTPDGGATGILLGAGILGVAAIRRKQS